MLRKPGGGSGTHGSASGWARLRAAGAAERDAGREDEALRLEDRARENDRVAERQAEGGRMEFGFYVDALICTLKLAPQNDLRIQARKSQFFTNELHYLGHVIKQWQLIPDQKHLEAVRSFPPPTDVSSLRRTIGLSGWLRRFIRGHATMAAPHNRLLAKGVAWRWTNLKQNAFDQLRGGFCQKPKTFWSRENTPLTVPDSLYGHIRQVLQQDAFP